MSHLDINHKDDSKSILLIIGFMRHFNILNVPFDITDVIESFVFEHLLIHNGKTMQFYGKESQQTYFCKSITIQQNGILTVEKWNGKIGGALYLYCVNDIILHTNAQINVNGRGYKGSTSYEMGEGPGGGRVMTDASYAVQIPSVIPSIHGGTVYGDKELTKLWLGSGGGIDDESWTDMKGGNGGGIISICSYGNIIMKEYSTITANGIKPRSCAGSGSGGSILIECNKLDMAENTSIQSKPHGRIRINLNKNSKSNIKKIEPKPFWG
eukprot:405425_1